MDSVPNPTGLAADRPLAGGGEMGALMRALDWSRTPAGPVRDWPPSLRITVSTMLASRHPMFLWWGPELVQFYNDAYRPSLGSDKHPSALGGRGRSTWPEIWPTIGPLIQSVMAGGESIWQEDALIPIERDKKLEDVFWTFGYSAVRDETGEVGGVLVVCTETTARVLGERRLSTARDELERRVEERTAELEAANAALEVFSEFMEAVGTESDVAALASRAVEVIERAVGADASAYYELDGGLWRASALSARTDPVTRAAALVGFPTSTPLLAVAAARLEPTFVDGPEFFRELPPAVVGEFVREYAAGAALPVVAHGVLRGLLTVGLKSGRFWQERDRAVVRAVARGLMVVLERAEAAGQLAAQAVELEARNSALEGFAALTRDLATETDPLRLVGRSQEIALSLLSQGVADYYELDGSVWRSRSQRGDYSAAPGVRAAIAAGLPSGSTPTLDRPWAAAEDRFVDAYAAEDSVGDDAVAIRATAVLPVSVAGEVRGLFGAGLLGREPHRWSGAERAVLQTVARQLGLALERAASVALLAEQKAELEARNAEQETFVYTVSHDLRQPLLAMQGMAQLLDEAVALGDTAEASFAAGRVRANLTRMSALLDDLLRLSRVGRADAEPEALDLGEVAAQVLAELDPRVRARGASVELPREWPRVLYPRNEALQLLGNLLENALKYGGREGEPPRVRLGWLAGDGRVTVRVEDDGLGVAPAHRERVFNLFQQLDATAEGTGVGLAIVKRIVERHGGRAWVEGSDLGGAAFVVTLPAERRSQPAPAPDGHERRRQG